MKLRAHIEPNWGYDSRGGAETVPFPCVGRSDAAGVRAFW